MDKIIEYVKQLKGIESCCFGTDREEQWFDIGVRCGLDVADSKSPWISVDEDLPCNHKELIHPITTDTTLYVVALIHGIIYLSRMYNLKANGIGNQTNLLTGFQYQNHQKNKRYGKKNIL